MSTSIIATPRPVRRAYFALKSAIELPLWLTHDLETEDLDIVMEGLTGDKWAPTWKVLDANSIELILQPEDVRHLDGVVVRITG